MNGKKSSRRSRKQVHAGSSRQSIRESIKSWRRSSADRRAFTADSETLGGATASMKMSKKIRLPARTGMVSVELDDVPDVRRFSMASRVITSQGTDLYYYEPVRLSYSK